MDNQTWTTTLTIETKPDDIAGMREWLGEYALPIPSRNADVLAKFISTTLISNAEWDGVFCRFTVKRPTLPKMPWESDYDEWPEPTEPTCRLGKLAIGSFGLLVMLAAFFIVGAGACRHSPHGTPLCYDTNRVINAARDTVSAGLATW